MKYVNELSIWKLLGITISINKNNLNIWVRNDLYKYYNRFFK